jgi:alanine dehydrogenase
MSMSYHILTDDDVRRLLPMPDAVRAMETAFREMANGSLVAPSRFRVESPDVALVFTAGAATAYEKVIGFRVYDILPSDSVADPVQMIAVYDSETGAFKGVIFGRLAGSMRTGAIDGVAIDHLARSDASTLAVIGAGYQARTQLAACMTVRAFNRVTLYSRTATRAEAFCREIADQHGVPCEIAGSAHEAVRGADVVVCATNSRVPVLETTWIEPGMHITTIGPKTVDAHELPLDIAGVCDIITTDSLAQVRAYDPPFYIGETEKIVGLDQIVAGHASGRESPEDITLFCSVGLAGTEVVLANRVFQRYEAEQAG